MIGDNGAVGTAYVDNIVFAYGQDDIALTAVSYGTPFPTGGEQTMLNLLVARAQHHPR